MVNLTEAEKYSDSSCTAVEDFEAQLQDSHEIVMAEIAKEVDKEILENIDCQFQEEVSMSVYEKGLNSF